MAISNPLKGERKAGTVGKPFPGVQVSYILSFSSVGRQNLSYSIPLWKNVCDMMR